VREQSGITPYLLRLDAQDQKHREQLESHYRRLHGRPVAFADILRRLMAEKVDELEVKRATNGDGGRISRAGIWGR
jgi:hypothetical protein